MLPTKQFYLLIIGNIIAWQYIFQLYYQQPATMTVLDVGQGESTLIQDQHTQILIDAGPDQSILSGLAQSLPAHDQTIELIILSHSHDDHYQGFNYLFSRYHIKQAIINGIADQNPDYQNFLSFLTQQRVNIHYAQAGQQIKLNDITIDLLFPFSSLQGQTTEEPNNTSIAVKITSPQISAIITGDLHQEIENQLVEHYHSDLQADILVVGHHGSKTSTGDLFLTTVHPQTVIIPVGLDNKFNHPSPETIDKLIQKNIEIKRTDLDGSVSIKL
ncbi:MAG TPA: MBL fold metallo-hydrolase [bacterium]|nr:MBL fold metallo-hydrolase [bacterium]